MRVGRTLQILGVSASLMARSSALLLAQKRLVAHPVTLIAGGVNDLSPFRLMSVATDGRIAILQPQDNLIRFFGSTGQADGTFGRAGEGPGEFHRLEGHASWIADTFWIDDPSSARVTYILSGKKLLRTVREPVSLRGPNADETGVGFGSLGLSAVAADGSILASVVFDGAAAKPPWVPKPLASGGYVRVAPTGKLIRVIMSSSPVHLEPSCGRTLLTTTRARIPLCDGTRSAIDGNGSRLVFVVPVGSTGSTGTYRLLIVNGLTGDTISDRLFTYVKTLIPQSVLDSIRTKLAQSKSMPDELRNAYASLPLPRYYPPVARMVISADKSVWLERYSASRTVHAWENVTEGGDNAATIDIPAGVSIVAASRTRLWGIAEDADGLQSVVAFTIRP